MANFKYSIKPEISIAPEGESLSKFIQIKTGDYNKFDSQCDKTMVGFVQTIPAITKDKQSMTSHRVTCFYGK